MKMNFNRPLILASKSPRRHQLLKDCGFEFEIISLDVDETFDPAMNPYEVAGFLSQKKAAGYEFVRENEVVITADTVVIHKDHILGKPESREEAILTLRQLSGNTHDVVTGVTIKSLKREITFDDKTSVTFKNMSESQIIHYIDNYEPYDKAGSYGAQDWIGLVAIERLEGSYFNVMGLPTHKVYDQLLKFS